MLATPLRPFLKEQISPRPQESMGIFDRITYSNVRLEVEKKKGKKKPRFLMNSRVFPDLSIPFQREKNTCTFELQILIGNSNQVVVFNLI